MSGYQDYRAIGDFAQRYKKQIVKYLELEKDKVPAYTTVRRVVQEIDHKSFGDIFTKWMKHYMKKSNSQWIAVDGKAIKGTKQKEEDKKLAHLVSFFASDSKEILIARKTAYNRVQEPSRNRFEVREIEIYNDFYNIDTNKFFGINEFVKVTRTTYLKNNDKISTETSFLYQAKKCLQKSIILVLEHTGQLKQCTLC